jgi:hypothetical protein
MNMSIRQLPIELIESEFKIDPVFLGKDWCVQYFLGMITKFELMFLVSISSFFLTRLQNLFI